MAHISQNWARTYLRTRGSLAIRRERYSVTASRTAGPVWKASVLCFSHTAITLSPASAIGAWSCCFASTFSPRSAGVMPKICRDLTSMESLMPSFSSNRLWRMAATRCDSLVDLTALFPTAKSGYITRNQSYRSLISMWAYWLSQVFRSIFALMNAGSCTSSALCTHSVRRWYRIQTPCHWRSRSTTFQMSSTVNRLRNCQANCVTM
mmetsp:Transcript_85279/g.241805  ORF Transcript_85279/g.241805 Transcript_85279/m.241805 type:complete len:207 (-) Transcript_85279:841-1461(-)